MLPDPIVSVLVADLNTTATAAAPAGSPPRAARAFRALCVALLSVAVLAPATAAAADRPAGAPPVHLGSITVPAVTVPSVTTPPVDVPAVRTPLVSTPAVHVPSVTTPAVSTPPVTVPAVTVPPVEAPAVEAPAVEAPRADAPVSPRPAVPAAAARATTAAQPSTPAAATTATPAAAQRPTASTAPRRPTAPRVRRRAHRSTPRAAGSARGRPGAPVPVALRRRVSAPDAVGPPPGDRASRPPVRAKVPDGPVARSLLPGAVEDIVDALPRWVVAVFLGFALIAVLMAINAYLASRRARALGVQRELLLDDVGLLQTALLAPVPAHAGDAQVSVAYRPAAGPAAGGDFYDVIALGPSHTGLLLGDVSGHGREALRHAALVRYTVRTFLAAGHDPADALARTDDTLRSDLDGRYATVIAAVYDHDAHTLRYAKAGHHPPVVLGITHDPDAEPVSPPVGAGLGIRPEGCELTLDPGSTVCLFTDGLIEARRDGALLGRETLAALLDEGRPDGPELLDRVVEHADEVSDDLAVCLLRRP